MVKFEFQKHYINTGREEYDEYCGFPEGYTVVYQFHSHVFLNGKSRLSKTFAILAEKRMRNTADFRKDIRFILEWHLRYIIGRQALK